MRVLVIDNYDSFTYNLVQYLGELGAEIEVVRNDRAEVGELAGGEGGGDRRVDHPARHVDAGRSEDYYSGFEDLRLDYLPSVRGKKSKFGEVVERALELQNELLELLELHPALLDLDLEVDVLLQRRVDLVRGELR